MDTMFQGIIMIFMLFICLLCFFAVVVIVRDIVRESINAKRESKLLKELLSTTQEHKEEEVPVSEPMLPVAERVVEEKDENEVAFSKNNLSLEEKYLMLSSEHKGFFDEIIKHALAKEGVSEHKRFSSYDYKIGSYRVLKMMIKRGEIVCEFTFIDRDLINYASTSGVKMKQSATTLRVDDASAVGAVKDGIDLVCNQIKEDKEYKKNLAREKQREKRKNSKEKIEA